MCDLIGVIVQKQVAMNAVVQLTHIYKRGDNALWIVPSVRSVLLARTAVKELCKELMPFDPRAWVRQGDDDLVYIQLSKDYGPYNAMRGRHWVWYRIHVDGIHYGMPMDAE